MMWGICFMEINIRRTHFDIPGDICAGAAGVGCCWVINERLIQVSQYKKRLESDKDLRLSAADIEKSIDYRIFGKQWKEQISES